MPNIVCRRKITCPGTDDPIANLSSEDEETNNWQSVGYCCDGTIKTASSDVSCEVADALLQDALNNDCPECPDEDGAAAITLNGIDDHICQYAAYGSQVTANTASDTLFFELYDGSLPTGLEFHGGETTCGSALIDGAAQEAGDFTFSIRVCDDSGNCAERTYTISVLGIVNLPMNDGVQGDVYSWTPIIAGGSGNYTFGMLSTLPTGLSFSTVNGAIYGTPTETGDFTLVMVVTDNATGISCNYILDMSITGTATGCYVYGAFRTIGAPLESWLNSVLTYFGKPSITNPVPYFPDPVYPTECAWREYLNPPLLIVSYGIEFHYSPSTLQRRLSVTYINLSATPPKHIYLNYTSSGGADTPNGIYAIVVGSSEWPSTPFGAPPATVVIT